MVSLEELKTAQDFFVDHSIQIMQALLHYSLAAGFARYVHGYLNLFVHRL